MADKVINGSLDVTGEISQNGHSIAPQINVTWAELKALRDGGTLVPGQQYRITDYQCTTTQANTSSAGHQFDIVVTADSANKLNEVARACLHTGDTYFANSNLNAWQLWYCLDNDTSRFAWAAPSVPSQITVDGDIATRDPSSDGGIEAYPEYTYAWAGDHSMFYYTSTEAPKTGDACSWHHDDSGHSGMGVIEYAPPSGKGVIYRMIDEFNNDVPYDFKNILFKRYKITACQKAPSLVTYYLGITNVSDITVDETDFIWCYTFTWIDENDEVKDCSIVAPTLKNDENQYDGLFNNTIKPCSAYTSIHPDNPTSFQFALNDIVIQGNYEYDGGFFYGMVGNVFESECFRNTLGCNASYNKFGHDCGNNILGHDCLSNNFAANCGSNIFGTSCSGNVLGAFCRLIIFRERCDGNTFGQSCLQNTFGEYCFHNNIHNKCYFNIFGSQCEHNTLEEQCSSNTFGCYCEYNTLGKYCSYNKFGQDQYLIFYCRYVTFDNGCSNLYLTSPDNIASSSNYLQNVHVHLGVVGPSAKNRKTISVPDRNLAYETNFIANSSNDIIV